MLAVRLPEELETRLQKLAKETGRSKSWYVREALKEYLGDMEDIYYAEKRYEDIRRNKMDTVSLDAVEQELGLGG